MQSNETITIKFNSHKAKKRFLEKIEKQGINMAILSESDTSLIAAFATKNDRKKAFQIFRETIFGEGKSHD